MIKLLPLGIVVVLMVGVLLYVKFNRPVSQITKSQSTTTEPAATFTPKTTTDDTGKRVRDLEEAVTLLSSKLAITPAPSSGVASYTTTYNDAKIKTLEDMVASLQKQIDSLKSAPTSTSKTVVYIPLGSGGSSTSRDWNSLEGYQVSLDPADYPGYKNMQLEINGKLAEAIGTGYARLYNVTGSSAVSSSDASTTATTYSLASSGNFTIPSGRKTYQLQLKSDQGKELYIQSARLKVNF